MVTDTHSRAAWLVKSLLLTVNRGIRAEHGRVPCTVVPWVRMRLDEAVGRVTHRQAHFDFLSNPPSLLLSLGFESAAYWPVYRNENAAPRSQIEPGTL